MEEDDFDVCRHLGLWDGQAWPGCFLLWVFLGVGQSESFRSGNSW